MDCGKTVAEAAADPPAIYEPDAKGENTRLQSAASEQSNPKAIMENFTSDTAYGVFSNEAHPNVELPMQDVPFPQSKSEGTQEPSLSRAETRRIRKTLREKKKKELGQDEHYKLSYGSGSSDDSSVDENFDVVSLTESENENLTWRGRMQHALHNNWFHVIIIGLVCLDALIVIFELLVDVGAFGNVICEGNNFLEQAENCHYRNPDDCGPHAEMIIKKVNISPSRGGNGANEDICECGFRRGKRDCIKFESTSGINPGIVLHVISLIILSTFMVEILLKLVAFRLKYFTHKFEVFDGIIVVISWILDVASVVQEEAFEAAALLIVLRLWRVIRIVNGAVLSSKAQSDRDLELSREHARKVIHALHRAQDKMDDFETENLKLKKYVESQKS